MLVCQYGTDLNVASMDCQKIQAYHWLCGYNFSMHILKTEVKKILLRKYFEMFW